MPDEGLVRSWTQFWFTPTPPVALRVVRFLAGLLFAFWLLPFGSDLDSLFGLQGWFDADAYVQGLAAPAQADPSSDDQRGVLDPLISWSLLYPKAVGGNPLALQLAYWLTLAVFVLFALGVATRLTAVLSWLAVVSFAANPAISYDGDSYLVVLAFYLMVAHVLLGQRTRGLSWAARLFGTREDWVFGRLLRADTPEPRPSLGATLGIRLLQVHFALIMVISGLHKLQFGDWWGGYALWYPLFPAGQATFDQAKAIASNAGEARVVMFILSAAAYAVLIWQIGFPLFAWRRAWRPVLLLGALIGWLADAFLYELPIMGPALFIGCLAFVSAAEWQRWSAWLAGLPGLAWLEKSEPAPDPEEKPVDVEKEAVAQLISVEQ